MQTKYEVIDAFELSDYAEYADVSDNCDDEKVKPVDELLVESVNLFGEVDMGYITRKGKVTVKGAVVLLKDAVFQLPEVFMSTDEYDPLKGWVISARYLSGDLRHKLTLAEKMNKRFRGMFTRNIKALRKNLPAEVFIDDIHINIGAPWIKYTWEYEDFIKDFLQLDEAPSVQFLEEVGRYKITAAPKASKSVLNTITYGVRADASKRASGQYMTALDIIEHTLNCATVKVCDYVEKSRGGWNNYTRVPVLNHDKTVEAQEKQKAICDAFREWVCADGERRRRFEEYYNNDFAGYVNRGYNGDFLTFPDLNPEVKLYKRQRDEIARALLSGGNTLFADPVGAGKTYEMVVTVHELYRMGLSKKNLVVVKKNILKDVADAHKHLYKDDRILVVYPKDFSPRHRNEVLEKIRDGGFTAVYMGYGSFDKITMSKAYYADLMADKIGKLRYASENSADKYERLTLMNEADRLSDKLYKYLEEKEESPWLSFEKLGVDTIVLDEAHNYKNIPIESRADNIVGMHKEGSSKCREMLHKVHNVKRAIFATATPMTNSMADLFAIQLYLQPETLRFHKLHRFDAWISTFAEQTTNVESDVNSKLRTMTRFSKFHNLSELTALFGQICNLNDAEKTPVELPRFKGAVNVSVPRNKAQAELMEGISERIDKVRGRKVPRDEDNMLKIIGDGKLLGLDARLVDDSFPEDFYAVSKVDYCARKVWELYRKFPGTAQVVFSDSGTPKASFNVYDALREKLTELGIPSDEIAFIHNAESEGAREKLFDAVNSAKVRVIIGSTAKLGEGVNIQKSLKALHHLSVPWRPSDLIQREGRIIRQGNTCGEVFVYRYVTESTFDAYLWQIIENKQRFISSFMSGSCNLRAVSDIGDTVLEYAEVKALAVGNPLIRKRFETDTLINRTKSASRARQIQLKEQRNVAEAALKEIARCEKRAKIADADFSFYQKNRSKVTLEERTAFGQELLEALKENISKNEERTFGGYQGFDVVLPADMYSERPYVLIKGPHGRDYPCKLSFDRTPVGLTKAVDYLLDHLDKRGESLRNMAKEAVHKRQSALEDIEKGNPYVAEIERLQRELEAIDNEIQETELKETEKESKAA